MIIAYGMLLPIFILLIVSVVPLVKGLKGNKSFEWDYKPTVLMFFLLLVIVQYIYDKGM